VPAAARARAVACDLCAFLAASPPRLEQDHKATDACERMRVEAMGGFVIRKRVMGVLAVARSFGDFVLKKYVPAEPYTSTTKLDAMVRMRAAGASGRWRRCARAARRITPPHRPRAQSEFIIIACDGVWDVMEDQEAVDLVRMHLRGGDGAGGAGLSRAEEEIRIKSSAQLLVDASLTRGSSDNVTAMVLFL
jgi:serine/threonine protein phosphatase PrpC